MLPMPRVFVSFTLFVFLVGLTACSNNLLAQPRVVASAVATPDLQQATPLPVLSPEVAVGLTSTTIANETRIALAIAATMTAPPPTTGTPNLAATAIERAQQMTTAVAATLTGQPTATPILAATSATEHNQMATAIAATLTAFVVATPVSERTATINTTTLNLRMGPGTIYAVIKSYRQRTVVIIIGKESGGQWLKVKTPDGEIGWMATRFLLLFTDLSNVPTVEVPPTPTPNH